MTLPGSAYARLLALRTGLRHFERWSAQQARAAGLTPAHHQLLLAVRGHQGPGGPTIGEVADYLLLRHHSAVGLVDRAEAAGLLKRARSEQDHRVVRLQLTPEGEARLEALTSLHIEELDRLAHDLSPLWQGLGPVQRPHGFPGEPGRKEASAEDAGLAALGPDSVPEARVTPARGARKGHGVEMARVYGPVPEVGKRVLVDRLWPRGVSRSQAPFDTWAKDVAPSPELRKWYGHVPERFEEFGRLYREELAQSPAREALAGLRSVVSEAPLVLVTATKDLERSGAAVLRDVLSGS